ncbi:citrulline utilization hydrolase CtlX [Epilithonimonas hominis]|uniref:citrulline utilization hydrolase CtlX n=1 Tax=Epilithonimonas hominis TaxID=420404 RepID=UPI002896E65B|nr:arginine deiminase-related protein [Epilithonimonas hominis]
MQTTDTVLMIEPVAFGFNEQTAVNNYFQVQQEGNVQEEALKEFNAFVEKLRAKDINVITIKDTLEPKTPDSIFPNNWVSFHADGKVVFYPMFAENRRLERRDDIINQIKEQFEVTEVIDYSGAEKDNLFLEGTGSMIFDHDNKLAYGSVSLRLDEGVFRKFCSDFGFQPVVFHSYQTAGEERLPIYHTNVMMCVADQFVVICLDCIDDESEKNNVIETIKNSGKELIEISEDQMQNFAGNMLQVQNKSGEKFLVMSQSAYKSLNRDQVSAIEKYCEIIYSNLEVIETNGGGSARCMLAEIFLPKK